MSINRRKNSSPLHPQSFGVPREISAGGALLDAVDEGRTMGILATEKFQIGGRGRFDCGDH
jgi:hypothetical protein